MLIIVGSRREGNSKKLANYIKTELESERINVNIIVPGNQRIHLCTGCMDCDKSGVCDFTDDMKKNIEMIKNEKVLLFITPTRWNLLSGDIKIFLDRLNPLYSTQGLKDKKAIIISIGSKPKDVYSTTESNSSLCSFAEAALMETILTKEFNNCLNAEDIMLHSNEIDNLVKEIKEIVHKY